MTKPPRGSDDGRGRDESGTQHPAAACFVRYPKRAPNERVLQGYASDRGFIGIVRAIGRGMDECHLLATRLYFDEIRRGIGRVHRRIALIGDRAWVLVGVDLYPGKSVHCTFEDWSGRFAVLQLEPGDLSDVPFTLDKQ